MDLEESGTDIVELSVFTVVVSVVDEEDGDPQEAMIPTIITVNSFFILLVLHDKKWFIKFIPVFLFGNPIGTLIFLPKESHSAISVPGTYGTIFTACIVN